MMISLGVHYTTTALDRVDNTYVSMCDDYFHPLYHTIRAIMIA